MGHHRLPDADGRLITVIFYYHPSTTNATCSSGRCRSFRRANGRVAEIYVRVQRRGRGGRSRIFRLDSSKQEAAVETARRKIAEVDAAMVRRADRHRCGRRADPGGAERPPAGRRRTGDQAGAAPAQPGQRRRPRDREAARRRGGRQGGVDAATRRKQAAETRLSTLLPAEKASAEAALAQAQVELDKTVVHAGVDRARRAVHAAGRRYRQPVHATGRRPDPGGCRPARLQAGFGQIEAQVMKVGMVAEVDLRLEALDDHPDGGDDVQDYIAAGQVRGGEQLIDAAAGDAAGNDPGLSGAAVRGRARRRDAGQQLHRQRLHQQSRPHRLRRRSAPGGGSFFTPSTRSRSCTP